jgi:hypothetical protein
MRRNRKNQTATKRFGPALKAAVLCLLTGGLCLGYVWQKDQIDRLGEQIKKREVRLKQLIKENEKRKEQLATMRSPHFLETRIQDLNLGLAAPQSTQVWKLPEPVSDLPQSPSANTQLAAQTGIRAVNAPGRNDERRMTE